MKFIKISAIFISLTFISCDESVSIKDDFTIRYEEMFSSISLTKLTDDNTSQVFVSDVTEAYWNNDSLVVSGNNGCFLIEFGKTQYNDEMVKIECDNLKNKLKKGSIKKYLLD
ncbi:hypothetical protein [Flavobacterium polysaccharolyticum]|uniref:Lipocalin-like domain-containing protein n=1 Tax=Flavobacterium polysaccharolyticum TaxID=3133148 RepID=A0ABU9NKH6_9FLAO